MTTVPTKNHKIEDCMGGIRRRSDFPFFLTKVEGRTLTSATRLELVPMK